MKVLKIKDKIPLSNLKKYGFYYSKSTHCWFEDIREYLNTYYETYAYCGAYTELGNFRL